MNQKTEIKLFAKTPIKSGGKVHYNKEFTVENEVVARDLVESGAAADVDGYFDEAEEDTAPDRETVIIDAIKTLKPETKTHWDDNGKPSLKALAKITDSIVTEEERDAAWEKVKPAATEE